MEEIKKEKIIKMSRANFEKNFDQAKILRELEERRVEDIEQSPVEVTPAPARIIPQPAPVQAPTPAPTVAPEVREEIKKQTPLNNEFALLLLLLLFNCRNR